MAGEITPPYFPTMLIPIPGVTSGPTYASDLSNALQILAAHDHSTNNGAPISINNAIFTGAVNFNSNAASALTSLQLNAQTLPPVAQGTLYVNGIDLWYTDGTHQIQITQNGSVTSSAGNITGMTGTTAQALYNILSLPIATPAFSFSSATNTPAALDASTLILRGAQATYGVAIKPPDTWSYNYTITLPPRATADSNFVTMDTSGEMHSYTQVDGTTVTANSNTISVGTITVHNIAANTITSNEISSTAGILGSQLSATAGITPSQITTNAKATSGSVTVQTTVATFTDIPGFATSITTHGHSVLVSLQPYPGVVATFPFTATPTLSDVLIQVDNGTVKRQFAGVNGDTTVSFIDSPSAGTITYRVAYAAFNSSTIAYITSYQLVVVEL